jgi:2'-5' RNA ligase
MANTKHEKLFVGLTFRSDSALSKKIDGFRKRFDPKYRQHSFLHMSMLAPFEVEAKDVVEVKEQLKEELETFFYGLETAPKLAFTGVNFTQSKKFNTLYLKPNYTTDLDYCMELVQDICKSFIPRSVKYKPNPKQFLPLGHFKEDEPLLEVMDAIKDEFSSNSELTITGISLFSKKYGIWHIEDRLISFNSLKDNFLHSHDASL